MSAPSETSSVDLSRFQPKALMRRLESPVAPYYLLLGSTAMLLLFGLVMVLSASSVTSYQASGSSYTVFKNQAMYAAIGVVLALVATRVSTKVWKWLALPAFAGAALLQLAVFSPIGRTVQGNRNWIGFGSFTVQPSEAGKIAIILVGGMVLTRKRRVLGEWRHVIIPFV